MICPKCGNSISEFEYAQYYTCTFKNNKKKITGEVKEEYFCPMCDATLAHDEKKAMEIFEASDDKEFEE